MSKKKLIFSIRLLRSFCPPHLLEEIEGDLIQRYERDLHPSDDSKRSDGYWRTRAKRRLLWNVIRYCRLGIVMRNRFAFNISDYMTLNNLKFSWRNIRRHRVFSVINIVGLAMGITVCLLILNYVVFERSSDHFFEHHEDIVRVGYTRLIDNQPQFSKAQVFPAIGEALKGSIPAVINHTRMFPIGEHVEAVLHIEEKGRVADFPETSLLAVDSTFLKIFSLSFLSGDKSSALAGENKIILSESTAIKYFGHTNVLNKVIQWKSMGDYVITGVFKDLPESSHFKFNILFSWMNVYEARHDWSWDGFYTYLLLRPKSDFNTVQSSVQQLLSEKTKQSDKDARVTAQFFLQPLTDIHLNSHLMGEMKPNGNARVINALSMVALLILLLAAVNYLNLSIARAVKRAKEVGMRKIIGSTRIQLMSLFFTESFLLVLIAFVTSIGLVLLLFPFFNSLVEKSVAIEIWNNTQQFAGLSVAFILFFALLAGYYPSQILTSFNPVVVLNGRILGSNNGNRLRKSLLVVQFLITIILVTVSFIIQRQVSFMQNQDLGFDLKKKVVFKSFSGAGEEIDSTFKAKMELLKSRLKENPSVQNVTITSTIPGRENEWKGRLKKSEGDKEFISTSLTRVDKDFISTYGLKLTAGRNFENENPKQIIINQSTARMLGYKSDQVAIGAILLTDCMVVGVIKDFHDRSLHEPIVPFMYVPGKGYMKFITVSVNSNDLNETLSSVQNRWQELFPGKPFEYFFLDDFFNRQYGQEKQLGRVFISFSSIGILIACLGLFGFTYFITHQRTKEIGIRKVLGASFRNLIRLLSSEFAFLLLVAGVIAAPVSYYFVEDWLSKYPVKVAIGVSDFLLPVAAVGLLTFGSIIILLVRAIKVNPTEVLKNE